MLQANQYGNIEKGSIPNDCVHVEGQRLQPLCRKLKIKFVPVLVGWKGTRNYPSPQLNGVAIYKQHEAKLRAMITEREERSNKSASRKERYLSQFTPNQRDWIESKPKVLLPSGEQWTRRMSCSEEAALVMQLSEADRNSWLVYADWLEEHGASADAAIIREQEEKRNKRHAQIVNSDLSLDWKEYLSRHDFYCETAEELARILKSPKQASPSWFREAIAVVNEYWCGEFDLTHAIISGWIREKRDENIRCFECGEYGHRACDCSWR